MRYLARELTMLYLCTMRSLAVQATLAMLLVQALACGFPRPADVEPDSGSTSPLCGNSKIEAGEDCDDGNTIDDGNGCDSQCHKNAICGDNNIQILFEICDGTSDCSFDCKESSILLFPISNRDARYNGTTGTWDVLNPENAQTGDVTWLAPAEGGPLEWRTAFEFDANSLRISGLLKAARLTISPTGLQPRSRTLELHGYSGNGAVTIEDMTADNPLGSFLAGPVSPIFFDVNTFIRMATNRGYPFMGFQLRLNKVNPTDVTWGTTVALKDNSDSNLRPRLEITYCADSNNDNRCD